MGKVYTIEIFCSKCGCFLYRYRKEKPGFLVKCYRDKILIDKTKGDLKCPQCGQEFARFKMYGGRPANKIIRGKITIGGHLKKDK